MDSHELSPWQHENFMGHQEIDDYFRNAIDQNKLHHAYLLHGTKGIGKCTFAFRLARYLFALNHKQEAEPSLFGDVLSEPMKGLDSELPSGIKNQVELLHYPDLLYVSTDNPKFKSTNKTNVITVQMAREVSRFLQLSSSHEGWRVIIFDRFDTLTNSAQNAVLKILEEPPKNVIFLLLTASPGYILQTIKSRCQKVFFSPLKAENLKLLLEKHFDDTPYYEAKLNKYAHYTQGSFGNLVRLIKHDGFEIIEAFTQILEQFEPVKASDYLDKVKVNQDPIHYEMLLQIIECWMSNKIKAGEDLDHWFALYDHYMMEIIGYQNAHLDKKYILLNFLNLSVFP